MMDSRKLLWDLEVMCVELHGLTGWSCEEEAHQRERINSFYRRKEDSSPRGASFCVFICACLCKQQQLKEHYTSWTGWIRGSTVTMGLLFLLGLWPNLLWKTSPVWGCFCKIDLYSCPDLVTKWSLDLDWYEPQQWISSCSKDLYIKETQRISQVLDDVGACVWATESLQQSDSSDQSPQSSSPSQW